MANKLSIATCNISGLNDITKREAVFTWFRAQQYDIVMLQETHCHLKWDGYRWSREWDGQSVWSRGINRSRGWGVGVGWGGVGGWVGGGGGGGGGWGVGVGVLPYYLMVDIDTTLAIHRLTVMGGTTSYWWLQIQINQYICPKCWIWQGEIYCKHK